MLLLQYGGDTSLHRPAGYLDCAGRAAYLLYGLQYVWIRHDIVHVWSGVTVEFELNDQEIYTIEGLYAEAIHMGTSYPGYLAGVGLCWWKSVSGAIYPYVPKIDYGLVYFVWKQLYDVFCLHADRYGTVLVL